MVSGQSARGRKPTIVFVLPKNIINKNRDKIKLKKRKKKEKNLQAFGPENLQRSRPNVLKISKVPGEENPKVSLFISIESVLTFRMFYYK